MKTIKIISILALSFLMSLGLFANSNIFVMEEEVYINDIPFSTSDVSVNCLYEMAMAEEFDLEEESYIDDIPFDTDCISMNCKYLKAMSTDFELPEEKYVDDIPFNTKKLVNKMLCKK